MPEFPLHEKLGVASRQNQPISTFFDDSHTFWYAVAVARSDDFVRLWLLMFVPPRYENKLQLISVSFTNICCLAEFQFEMMFWILVFIFLRISLFWIDEKVFLLGPGVFVFLEIICEVTFQMMKLLILDLWRLSIKISEFGCWISHHGGSPWQELFFDGKSHIKPCFSKLVGCRLAAKPTNLSLRWWLSLFLVRTCCCSEWWFCPSVTPDVRTTKLWKQIAGHHSFFTQNLLSRGIPVWIDVLDGWYSTSWGFLCFESMKWSCFSGTKFSCFFEMSFLGVILNDEASSIILLETHHEYLTLAVESFNRNPMRISLKWTVC